MDDAGEHRQAGIGAEAAPGWPVTLTCGEPAGVARRGEPVTAGVPFPPGLLHEPRRVVLRDPAGTALPLQVAVLSRWGDGSVRWLLVDFVADAPAAGASTYYLDEAPAAAPPMHTGSTPAGAGPIGADATGGTGGAATLTSGPDGPDGPEGRMELAGGGLACILGPATDGPAGRLLGVQLTPPGEGPSAPAVGLDVRARDTAGRVYPGWRSAPAILPQAAGPLRAAVGARGELALAGPGPAAGSAPGPSLALRVQTFAAQPQVQLELTIENRSAEPLHLEAVQVVAILAGTPRRVACAGREGLAGPGVADEDVAGADPLGVAPRPKVDADTGMLEAVDAVEGALLEAVQRGPTAWGLPTPFLLQTRRWPPPAAGGTGRAPRPSPARALLVAPGPDQAWQTWEAEEGRLATGWCAAETATVRAALAVRRFAPLHPKGVAAAVVDGAARLVVSLVPSGGDGLMLAAGMAATMELLLRVEPEPGTAPADADRGAGGGQVPQPASAWGRFAAAAARAFDAPLQACADPAWVCATGALGALAPADTERFPRYEWLAQSGLGALAAAREARREWGQLDYGDWAYDRYPQGWGNVEYDLPHALFLLYARSGERRFFDWAVDAARHYRDVDVNHGGHPGLPAGAPHVHSTQHAAGGYALGHTWLEGLLDWHYLTGDARALEVARGIADCCAAAAATTTFIGRQERGMGWTLICLTEMHRATGEARYLDACAPIIQQALAWQDPALGHWPNPLGNCACDQPTKCVGGKPFMVGMVLEGLRRYHELTGEARVAEAIVRAARWLVRDDIWIAADHGFVYSSCRGDRGRGRRGEIRALEGLLYAYHLAGERRFLDVALDAWEAALEPVGQPYHLDRQGRDSVGKGYATLTRSTPHVLAYLARTLPDRSW